MTIAPSSFSRRELVAHLAAGGGLLLLAGAALAAPVKTRLIMHRSPGCGCCTKWAEAGRKAGFDVRIVDDPEIYALKSKLGVPEKLFSCHTTIAGPYAIEGHVPLAAVKKLLARRPRIKGIGVPGMPLGSPGMEVPGQAAQPFQVYAYDAAGKIAIFV